MPSLAAAGIAFSSDEIRSALESAAIPGFTGTLQVEIGLRPEAAQFVTFAVIRRQSHREEKPATTSTRQELPDPTRKKPVDSVIDKIRSKLLIRTVVTAVEAHYVNGVLQPHWTHEE
jgi:hypothetical protein